MILLALCHAISWAVKGIHGNKICDKSAEDQWDVHDYCQLSGYFVKIYIQVLPSHIVDLFY